MIKKASKYRKFLDISGTVLLVSVLVIWSFFASTNTDGVVEQNQYDVQSLLERVEQLEQKVK